MEEGTPKTVVSSRRSPFSRGEGGDGRSANAGQKIVVQPLPFRCCLSLLLRVLSLLRLLINELFSLETKPFLGLENRLLPTPLPAVPTSALLYKGD